LATTSVQLSSPVLLLAPPSPITMGPRSAVRVSRALVSRGLSAGAASRTPASGADEAMAVVPPGALELAPPAPALLVLPPDDDVAPPDEPPLAAPDPPLALDELPPLPAELAVDLPPETLAGPLALLPPLLEAEVPLEPPPAAVLLLLDGSASLLQAAEPRPANARKAETNGTPHLEYMKASVHT